MSSIRLSKVTINDLETLQNIAQSTFFETFSAVNTAENMQHYLNTELSAEKLAASISDQSVLFYLAQDENKTIGYLKLNTGQSQNELKDKNSVEIERIYVAKAYHGHQVGHILLEKAIEIATQREADFVWLGVWEENPRAIAFYKKNGFIEFDQHKFILGDDVQTDIMMKRTLNG
jgi:diamine N-acetyltransferase